MRIVYILAGAGGMYCGACNRDADLVNGIVKKGLDIELIPLYTPLRHDNEQPLQTSRIFYGGIITFLEQRLKIFRHTPAFFDYLFDNPTLLKILGKFTIATQPQKLGAMTVSVLAGKDGNQKKELQKLIEYLQTVKPDVINITNSMLSGIAVSLKEALNIPIVCTFQGEEAFIDSLSEPHRTQAKNLLESNAQSIDHFIVPHNRYVDEIISYLKISRDKMSVILPGVDHQRFVFQDSCDQSGKIGYLSRIAPEKGLDTLLEAFSILHKKNNDLTLHIAGQIYVKSFWEKMQKYIKKNKLTEHVIYHGELTLKQKQQFLQQCNVFCVPSKFNESRGLAILEAVATGTPVVVPPMGIYPQIVEDTQHGIIADPATPENFASCINDALQNEAKYRGENRDIFLQKYGLTRMVDEIILLYEGLVSKKT
ncbi:glycosyltransferase family 4 protein [Candidatus Uabimicrobium amorphum]|uniref:Glycosyl transferase family 1 n=1 Tax=Uabimicrobium amorphum TaxID=2596890 RepID=A0A5S9INQ7_UABAM|nr:glycosyltransferase family 4 protein [Candidatus Uabimicrobium amorphum]BBM84887.1 glycosyl transferase family 1 [Candidatus Uabimicrobium amorphum]